jgi:hypothetical protein
MTVKVDNTESVVRALRELGGQEVLVGIPESSASRQGDPISNAVIGYIMETGSPAQNVPARPWLVPGVSKVLRTALEHVVNAAGALVDGNRAKADAELNAAGIVAMNGARTEISSNIPPPLAPSTIRGRKYARGTKSRRPEEDRYHALVKGGMPPGEAQNAAGIVSLISTAQLRNSITYVIRRIKGK